MEDGALRIILIGPPGVGKGTVGALLREKTGATILSSGEIFRREMEQGTELGHLANEYIKHGELVPNRVTIGMMEKRLNQPDVVAGGFVLDGFPRTVKQAEALDEILFNLGIGLDKAISLEVPDDVVVARLSGRLGCTRCGAIYHAQNKPPLRDGLCDVCNSPLFVRSDDQPDTIRERIRVFWEATAPVVDYYAATGNLQRIDAQSSPESVAAVIVSTPA